MLDFFRKSSQTLVARLFFSVLALSFVAWGVGDFVSGRYDTTALSVGKTDISVYEFERSYNQLLGKLKPALRSKVKEDPSMAAQLGLANKVIDDLTNTALVSYAAKQLSFRASDAQVKDVITHTPDFQDESGAFSPSVYKALLAQNNFTVESYENLIRTQVIQATVGALFKPVFSDNATFQRALLQETEVADVNVLTVSSADVEQPAAPDDKTLQKYFDTHKAKYRLPETRSFDVLTLTPQTVAAKLTVKPADVKAKYDADPASFAEKEKRRASHILVNTPAEADAVLARLNKGEDFAAVAKSTSKDTVSAAKGGDLGFFTYDDMVPAFSAAAFALKAGQLSKPVKSSFGYHIIKLTDVQPAKPRAFETVKAEIEKTLRAEQSQDAYLDALEEMEKKASDGDDFAALAKEYGATLSSYTDKTQEDVATLPHADKLLPSIFETDEKTASSVIEFGKDALGQDEGAALVFIRKVTAERDQTLEEARATVQKDYMDKQLDAKIRGKAEALLTLRLAATDKASLAALAQSRGIHTPVRAYQGLSHEAANTPEWLTSSLNTVFTTRAGTPVPQVLSVGPHSVAIVEVTAHRASTPSPEQTLRARYKLSSDIAADTLQSFLAALKKDAPVSVNISVVERVTGKGGYDPNAGGMLPQAEPSE